MFMLLLKLRSNDFIHRQHAPLNNPVMHPAITHIYWSLHINYFHTDVSKMVYKEPTGLTVAASLVKANLLIKTG